MTATLAVIPARWSSSRFPGKVLAPLAGRPVILHVLERVLACRRVDRAIVATDDARVVEVVEGAGHAAVLTRSDHISGSDRIAEAIVGQEARVILNVQGDEPLIDPQALDRLLAALESGPAQAATLAVPVPGAAGAPNDPNDPNMVKVVCDLSSIALYFSRAPIPGTHPTNPAGVSWLRHVGVYAFERAAFEAFVAYPASPLELREGLEQLRFLEHGGRMHVEVIESAPPGVDTPEDLARCEALLAQAGGPV